MTDYRPIPCAAYDRYERAIMHRERLILAWTAEDGGSRIGRVEPVDLRTRAGAEFLLVRWADGHQEDIRLDRILRCEPPARSRQ
jgi:Rho-binding antiterminator